MKKILSILIILIISQHLIAQTKIKQDKDVNTNNVIVTIGGPFLFNLSIAKDFTIIESLPSLKWRNSVSIIQGAYYNGDDNPPGAVALGSEIAFLTNPESHSFDFSAGIGLSIIQTSQGTKSNEQFPTLFPRFNLGLRLRPRDEAFLRLGIGFPEILGLSVGF